MAGAGTVTLDADGIRIGEGVGGASKIGWDFSGTVKASIWSRLNGSQPELNIEVGPATGTNPSIMWILAKDSNAVETGVYIQQSTLGGSTGTISLFAEGTTRLYVNQNGIRATGDIRLSDGIAAPAAAGGYAILYVDSADGDLKVKFSDGTVTTIATD